MSRVQNMFAVAVLVAISASLVLCSHAEVELSRVKACVPGQQMTLPPPLNRKCTCIHSVSSPSGVEWSCEPKVWEPVDTAPTPAAMAQSKLEVARVRACVIGQEFTILNNKCTCVASSVEPAGVEWTCEPMVLEAPPVQSKLNRHRLCELGQEKTLPDKKCTCVRASASPFGVVWRCEPKVLEESAPVPAAQSKLNRFRLCELGQEMNLPDKKCTCVHASTGPFGVIWSCEPKVLEKTAPVPAALSKLHVVHVCKEGDQFTLPAPYNVKCTCHPSILESVQWSCEPLVQETSPAAVAEPVNKFFNAALATPKCNFKPGFVGCGHNGAKCMSSGKTCTCSRNVWVC